MRRAGPRDKLLLGVLLPLWLLFAALYLRSALFPPRFPAIGVEADAAGGPPVVIGVPAWVERGGSELAIGDRLLRINDIDLRGMGPVGFGAHFIAEAAHGRPAPRVIYQRGDLRGETTSPVVDSPSLPMSLANGFVSFGFAAAGVLLSLRATSSRLVRWASRGLLLWALTSICFFYGNAGLNAAILAVIVATWSLAYPLCLHALLVFDRETRPLALGSASGRGSLRWSGRRR